MSYNLWKFFFDDDVDGFRQYLARATFDRNASKSLASVHATPALKVGSPSHLASSPKALLKSRKNGGIVASVGKNTIVLTRTDINARDGLGRTLLHHAVSSRSDKSLDFVQLLLAVPVLDLYVQDTESGWTALHRALYFGNIAVAQALVVKDIQNATDYTTYVSHVNAGGLVKIKDHEGNSPFELFGLTTALRDLQLLLNAKLLEDADTISVQSMEMDDTTALRSREALNPMANLQGDEVYAFGSNKNITLGLGDGDDRSFPERIQLRRPVDLLQRLWEDFLAQREKDSINDDVTTSLSELKELPAVIKNKAIIIQDVVMSKLHTAILTKDPISNLHICGFGPGGRLGTGDEATSFNFTCIQAGGLAKRRVSSIALGVDHSVAVCSSGEVFTWGSNKFGQLGYELPEVSVGDVPMQLTPRQIYGLIKKEQIIGVAASSVHSAIYTSSGLYTFGKNEGQLGLMDADARSLEAQIIPRRVGVSVIQFAIQSVAAIDRATTVLLENHDVIVFTHYGWTKVVFLLDSFGSSIASEAFFTRHKRQTKHISKLTAGGNTICALTSYGEVFTIDVPRHAESSLSKSTTNPSKARNALPSPVKVWSIRKSHMAATDAAVGQDGSIILCTASGTVWKKEKRANIKSVHDGIGQAKTKDYKFVRVPNIFGAIAVRSNCFGAFTAVRKDCNVMKEQISIGAPTIWTDIFGLLAFRDYGAEHPDEASNEPQQRLWKPAIKGPCPALIKRALLLNPNAEADFLHLSQRFDPLSNSAYDVWVTSTETDVRLPVHSLILKTRSRVLRRALSDFSESYYFCVPDVLCLEYGANGQIQLNFPGTDFLTIVNFVLYIYTDNVAEVWRFTSKALHLASRYRAVRTELMKLATALEMKHLERAVRAMDEPVRYLRNDLESAFHDSDLFSDADVVIDLADGEERYAHSVVLQSRCPFFEGLFHGHTGGMWLATRRRGTDEAPQPVRVDLGHIDVDVFEIVLRHIYADTGEELFDAIATKNLDEFIDLVIDVMAVANELMLDRLARVCQRVVGYFVTPWNVCGLLNTISESSETEFKQAGLEYIGLNLEKMLEQRLLEELDEYLIEELNDSVQSNQLAFMPIARSDRALEILIEQHPHLPEGMEQSKQRLLDSMRLPSRYAAEVIRPSTANRMPSGGTQAEIHLENRHVEGRGKLSPPTASPKQTVLDDLPFEMDEEGAAQPKPGFSALTSAQLSELPERTARPSFSRLSSSQQSRDEDHELHSANTTPRVSVSNTANIMSTSSNASRSVWAAATPTSHGLGLRDIMLQDSSVRVSNLTQSLKNAAVVSKPVQVKVSQKERKRQHHEQKTQHEAESVKLMDTTGDLPQTGSSIPQSPWQKITPKTQATSTVQEEAVIPSPSAPRAKDYSSARATPVKQNLTDKVEKASQPARSVLTAGMTGASGAPPPQIQSIRHTRAAPRSFSRFDARTPMAEIVAQQQSEKIAIKGTGVKRSLQEIQQEQEFQEWWDKESQRIQAEEAAANVTSIRKPNGGRGRGGNRRRGQCGDEIRSERIQAPKTASENNSAQESKAESSQRSRPNRGRGSFRGRGNVVNS